MGIFLFEMLVTQWLFADGITHCYGIFILGGIIPYINVFPRLDTVRESGCLVWSDVIEVLVANRHGFSQSLVATIIICRVIFLFPSYRAFNGDMQLR